MPDHDEVLRALNDLNDKVSRMERKLFQGNGDSVMTRIRVLEYTQKTMLEREGTEDQRSFTVKMAVAGLLFSVIGGVIVSVIGILI